MASSSKPKLGLLLRLKEFHLDPEGVFLNHGSYGVATKRTLSLQRWLMEEMESHPDTWFRRKHPTYYMETLTVLCEFLGTKVQNTVMVENATSGLNSVVRSLPLIKKDAILITNLSYNAVEVLVRLVNSLPQGPELVKLNIKFPLNSKEDVVRQFRQCMEEHPNIKLAIIDHISSPTSVLMPVKELTEFFHERDVMVLVDGAHAAGQIKDLNVEDYKADFYTGNLHKWLFTTKTSGFLWVDPKYQSIIRPALVSHFHGDGFHIDFCIRGTFDNTPFYTIPSAIEFMEELGGMNTITTYNRKLMGETLERLIKAWGTQLLVSSPELEAPFMRVLRLPDMDRYPKSAVGAGNLETDLFKEYNIQTLCIHFEGELYIRLSVHIYNCLEDFVKLEKAILEMITKPKNTVNEKNYDSPLMHWDLSPLMEGLSLKGK